MPTTRQASNSPVYYQTGFALALAVGLFAICSILFPNNHSMWVDETSSYFFASLPTGDFIEHLAKAEANMSLYYLALKVHMLGGGSSAAYVRGLSVVFALLAIAGMYLFSKRYINARVALWVAGIAALNPHIYKYAWEARSYSMTLFFGALLLGLFWYAMEGNRRRTWLAYGLAAGIGLYSHIFLVLLVFVQFLFSLFYCTLQKQWREYFFHLLLSGILLCAIAAPLLYFFMVAGSDAPNIDWIKKAGLGRTWDVLENALKSKYSWHTVPRMLSTGLVSFTLISAIILALQGLLRERRSLPNYLPIYLGMCAVLPILLAYGLQAIRPVFVERYLIFIVPAFLILCVWAIDSLPRRWLKYGALASLCVAQAGGMYESHQRKTFDYHSLYSDLAANCQPGSTLAFTNASVATTYYYYREAYPGLGDCFAHIVPAKLGYKNFYHTLEFDELPRPQAGTMEWVVFGHVGNAERSIHQLHDASKLATLGIERHFYRRYPIGLALIELESKATRSD